MRLYIDTLLKLNAPDTRIAVNAALVCIGMEHGMELVAMQANFLCHNSIFSSAPYSKLLEYTQKCNLKLIFLPPSS